jgi:hypothetical protein
MTDRVTHKPVQVSAFGTAPAYIRVSHDQLDELQRFLADNGIRFRANENIISLSGSPFFAKINLERGVDAQVVQRLLDSQP